MINSIEKQTGDYWWLHMVVQTGIVMEFYGYIFAFSNGP